MPTDDDVARVRAWCDDHAFADVRFRADVDGSAIVLSEVRPVFRGEGEISVPIARLRRSGSSWELSWQDSSDRWHRWRELPAGADLDRVLEEIDDNPDGVFFG